MTTTPEPGATEAGEQDEAARASTDAVDLEAIRELLNAARHPGGLSPLRAKTFQVAYGRDVARLLTEMGRLRAELAAAQAEVARLEELNVIQHRRIAEQHAQLEQQRTHTQAAQAVVEDMKADHERAERYEAGLRGEIQQLTEQVGSLLTTLTQDDFPDPAILHSKCQKELQAAQAVVEAAQGRETALQDAYGCVDCGGNFCLDHDIAVTKADDRLRAALARLPADSNG